MNLYKNLSGDQDCPYCEPGRSLPTGLVHVTTNPKFNMDEYGPCPHCEAGARAEARMWKHGYWQGRPAEVPRPKPIAYSRIPFGGLYVDLKPGHETVLTPAENDAREQLLIRRFNGEKVDPAVGIDMPSGEKRRALVERELAK